MLKSLKDWENFLDAPELTAYLVYSILKSFLLLFMFCIGCGSKKIAEKCNACNSKSWCLWKYFIKLMAIVVDALFGTPLGVVQRTNNEYKEKKVDGHDIQTLYIRRTSLSDTEIAILAMVTLTFALTAFTTFWDRFWILETISCVNDPDTYCYPIAIFSELESNINLNTSHRIENCSRWQDLNTDGKITFRCFKFVHNLGDALGAVGGLITIFGVSTRFVTKAMIVLAKFIVDNERECPEVCPKCCKSQCCSCWSFMITTCCLCLCCYESDCCQDDESLCRPQYHKWLLRVITAMFLALIVMMCQRAF